MPKSKYSEEEAVQKPAGELLHGELGWDLVYCYDEETLGKDGTLGRTSYEEVILERYRNLTNGWKRKRFLPLLLPLKAP